MSYKEEEKRALLQNTSNEKSEEQSLLQNDDRRRNYLYSSPEIQVTSCSDYEGGSQVKIINGVTKETEPPKTKVYKRRYYILIVYSLLAFTQGALWNTWGPIAASSEDAFGWTDGDIALFANWGPISYIIATFILSWIVDVKGLRWACVLSAFLVAVGAGVRCITDQPPYVTWTVNIGQFLNGLAGPVCMGVPPVLSAIWFPANERTTATAFSFEWNSFGVAIQFILGPLLVSDLSKRDNSTIGNESYVNISTKNENTSDIIAQDIAIERNQIMKYMYYEAAWSVFVFLLVLIYFPAKPPLPPTVTASTERLDYKNGVKGLFRHKKFWLICFTYGISTGVYGCWQSVLDINLKPHGIPETEAGWLGLYAGLAGCVAAVIVAKFNDVFSKHIRLFLLVAYIGAVAFFTWFTLILNGTLPDSTVSLYSSIIIATILISVVSPLYFEMACEATYPIAEGITNFVLTFINNVAGLIFLLVQMIPNIGSAWENWCLLGAIGSCIPVLLLLKERYNRLEIDENSPKDESK